MDSDGGLVEQDGKRYSRISGEKAFRIRFDIQLYFQYRGESRIRGDFDTPESYRRKSSEEPEYAGIDRSWWRDQDFFIEVAQDRDEYVPEHQSTPGATTSAVVATTSAEGATPRCDHG